MAHAAGSVVPDDAGRVPAESRSATGLAQGEFEPGRTLALRVHRELRRQILAGEFAPGAVIRQAEIARDFAVSRTPMREAFRLLQEEGLLELRPDQPARVLAVDPAALDSTYATRIMLEAAGVAMTLSTIPDALVGEFRGSLARMRATGRPPADDWFAEHRAFHALSTSGAPEQMRRQLAALREHSERYVRFDGGSHRGAAERADKEHEALVEAFNARQVRVAVDTIATHLARTALAILSDVAPDMEPRAIRTSLKLILGTTW